MQRNEAYIGVLIDDLITKGTEEPYRMFTSRAEYRTLLRQDNADLRLTPKAHETGIVDQQAMERVKRKEDETQSMVNYLRTTSFDHEQLNPILEQNNSALVKQNDKLFKILARPQINLMSLRSLPEIHAYLEKKDLSEEVLEQVEIRVKYQGYIDKEQENADKLNRLENVKIPKDYNFSNIPSLSYEAREKLKSIQPATVSQASRISGVSPSDISVLLVHMGR